MQHRTPFLSHGRTRALALRYGRLVASIEGEPGRVRRLAGTGGHREGIRKQAGLRLVQADFVPPHGRASTLGCSDAKLI